MTDIIIPIVLGVLFVGGGIFFFIKNFATSKSNTTTGKGGSVTTIVSPANGAEKDILHEKEDELCEERDRLFREEDKVYGTEETLDNFDGVNTPIKRITTEIKPKEL